MRNCVCALPYNGSVRIWPSESTLTRPRCSITEHGRSARRRIASTEDGFANFHSHEDILLQKLLWYHTGGEVSDRQWRDVLAIVIKQGSRLDLDYLRTTAAEAGLTALLTRLLGALGQ